MGEGAAIFILKRLADAEREGDAIYAVLRGIAGSSDGRGKGITAPNPIGQKICVERAWQNAGLSPATVTMIEGHGTSTRVGDVVEAQSMADILSHENLPAKSVALGSVKSNIGHLKGAAGAAGMLKAILALRDKVLPPSLHCEHPSPDIDFSRSPLYVNTELKPWTISTDGVRRAGVSAFGFGGTNFHVVLEEHIPGKLNGNGKRSVAVPTTAPKVTKEVTMRANSPSEVTPNVSSNYKAPLRGALVIGADSEAVLAERLRAVQKFAEAGSAPVPTTPAESDLRATDRLAIDYADAADLASKSAMALKAFEVNQSAFWKALRGQGIFRGSGPAPKVAFLYTGQGSQYANMLRTLCEADPIVGETFREADRVMTPLLGKPLTEFIFVDPDDAAAVAKAEEDLRQTEITQPAVLAIDIGVTRLLAAYGIQPDMTMGHSLGEYGALIASGAISFEDALEAVSARGRGMARVAVGEKGLMAAVFAPLAEVERILKTITGYVVIANVNSTTQSVIGGASKAVEQATEVFLQGGYNVVPLPVSHAFHTSIVAPASEPLRQMLQHLKLQPPRVPVIANLNGEFYPTGSDAVPQMLNLLAQQVASPVQFVKGLHTLYEAGARVFVEVGPKKALQGFAEDVLGGNGEVVSLFTNHPKIGDIAAFNQALCGLYAAGLGRGQAEASLEVVAKPMTSQSAIVAPVNSKPMPAPVASDAFTPEVTPSNGNSHDELGRVVADALDRAGWQIYHGKEHAPTCAPVVITGASLGLPGTDHIFDDENIARLLRGEQFIDVIPARLRREILEKHITRLVKSNNAEPTFETIEDVADVIKLAGRGGDFDLEKEFGVPSERLAALDRVTRLAIGVGIDALRDAGIPLVLRYKTTTKGTQLRDRWALPDEMRDDTGVIFASAFPAVDTWARITAEFYEDRHRREQLNELKDLRARISMEGQEDLAQEIDRRIAELQDAIEREPYVFDRRFLFHVLSMGHSQFAEYIGARGPNTQINAACASTTQAVAIAEDWIRTGRCRRVVVISADDITTDSLLGWFGAGFLASGVAATDEVVESAALPFDRRRHGMIIGMGAASLVVESAEAARERGIQPICEVLSTMIGNSAFHGTRLDVQHIGQVMEQLLKKAEAGSGIRREQIAPHTVFVSHETYTPARGGSASAEIFGLRKVFGDSADQIVIANTKGFTGHAMGAGIEDVLAVKSLETGCVPPVANFKEIDPELGALNLSKGGSYPVEYALRLGAGFGSQISMTLLRWVKTKTGVRQAANALGFRYRVADPDTWNRWLKRVSGYSGAELEIVHRTLRVREKIAARVTESATQAIATPPVQPEIEVQVPRATRQVQTPKAAPVVQAIAVEARAPEVKPAIPAKVETTAVAERPSLASDPVKEKVLALVTEKTGYPADMLALDLDLEADLGVDTVKQAEMFAAIREIYNIPRDENRKLRDYPTLAHVIRFVYEKRPDLVNAQSTSVLAEKITERPVAAPTASEPEAINATDPVKERILELVVAKTGYPKDMLDLELDLEADLGVDTVKQAEMFAAIREMYNIPRDDNRKLRDYPSLGHVIRFVYEKRPDLAVTAAPLTSVEVNTSTPKSEPVSEAVNTGHVNEDAIKNKILEIVAEKTGYPQDMLDLDLDLEADLGVDTVKQAEMFAAVRAAYNIPRDETLKLRDFPTLAHVIRFARERTGQDKTVAVAVAAAASSGSTRKTTVSVQPAVPKVRPVAASFDAANRIPRRVPVPVLRPPLSICKPTGATLGSGSRVIIMPDKNGVAAALAGKLKAKGVEVLLLDSTLDEKTLSDRLKASSSNGPIQGVYWLPALDNEGPLSGMDLATWREALQVRVKSLYATMQALYQHIEAANTFLITATRLGGQHGYDGAGAVAPMGGTVVGFTKTFKRERTGALVKAVDFEAERSATEIAELIVAETLVDPGAVEIGYEGGLRWSVGLQEQPAVDGRKGLTLNHDTVFLVTGAAGSIVSAITADLAAASGGTFYLLDLVPEPDPTNDDIKRFARDKEGLKLDLAARIKEREKRVTPAMVEKELASLERAQAAQSAIDAVRAAGGTAHYFSVNLTDAAAVAKVIEQVRKQDGHIDVLLHAAGLERSHFLPDKDRKEFDLVFDVKADGWFNLLKAIGEMPVNATVAFSSIAGRFGNAGQADYSSANDLLCKITSSFRSTRSQTRGIAIDWTAWGGIGMASRGSIPKMMELAGIDMLPPEAGIPLIRRELTCGGTSGEIVIGNRLGVLLNEFDATGGLDLEVLQKSLGETPEQGPMVGKITGMGIYCGLTMETTLDPASQPFLKDHRIDGTPVLPGVMGIEAFAEAALCVHPGWHVESIEEVNFLAPFKFYKNDPRTLTIEATFHPQGDRLVADCRLIGKRTLPNQSEPQETLHFTARVLVGKQTPEAVKGPVPRLSAESIVNAAQIYRIYFHGPAYQVLERAWWDGSRVIGEMATDLPVNHEPSKLPTLMAPRLIELCFQTAGLWEMGAKNQMGLPVHVEQVSWSREPESAEGHLYAVVTPHPEEGTFDAEVVDSIGNRYVRIEGYRTAALASGVDAESLKTLRSVVAPSESIAA